MYAIIPQKIPQNRRAEINEKILFSIDSGKDEIPAESIYNCYTGIGGLHNLRQSDFANYNEFAQAKKEFEMGQFFTPHELCRDMVEILSPSASDMVMEMCCGMGNFINFLPNQHNAYGFDIDDKAITVARYLYPNATIEQCDIRRYKPDKHFDVVIGNPPFNLKFDRELSQSYYMSKACEVLNPAGFLMLIVPASFLQNEFWDASRVAAVNRGFSFIGQTQLAPDTFASVGVENFDTKIMVFLRKSEHITMNAYCAKEFVTMDELREKIAEAKRIKMRLRISLQREALVIDKQELESFEFKLSKYLFELKAHKHLNKHLDKAIALVTKFRNQCPPKDCSYEEFQLWDKNKLTTAEVLSVIRKYIRRQNVISRKDVALVKTNYGFKLKQYAPRLLDKVSNREATINDLVLEQAELPTPETITRANARQIRAARKLIKHKRRQYDIQNQKFSEMTPDAKLTQYLNAQRFFNKDFDTCEFTNLQKHDLNLVLQKRYSLLNWQQGSGKTAAVYHRAKYLLKFRKVRNVVVLAPAIATNMTWESFLKVNKEEYRMIRNYSDLDSVPEGIFLIVSSSMLGKLNRLFMHFMKLRSQKVCLIYDESDEITNPLSQRTRNALSVFRRAKYKILDTGTTTRNNIAELYSQIELLYNNSVNMTCWCNTIYHEDKDREITNDSNPYYGNPFPAYRGHVLFKACHCPGKVSVFGIEKQNQDVYNKDELFDLIDKTIITRKFRDFAGEKYKIKMHTVKPSEAEHEVYRVIVEEFCRICEIYFNSTGDSKKDAGLRLMRQIKLLIRACSVPNTFDGYDGTPYPSKAHVIGKMIRSIPGKVAIGCTSLEAFRMYEQYVREVFPERRLFVVSGSIPFKKRQKIVDEFDTTLNGVLISTQQSLSMSVNIPNCNDVILEALQWNIPKMEQYYFRFIRLDSKEMKNVHYVCYEDSIEQNLMALVLTKERLNEFIKSGEVKEQSEIFEEFGVIMSIIDSLLIRTQDSQGKFHVSWGSQRIAS